MRNEWRGSGKERSLYSGSCNPIARENAPWPELETLLLELLEDREILSVNTSETVDRLLDIIGQSLNVPRRASDETLVIEK